MLSIELNTYSTPLDVTPVVYILPEEMASVMIVLCPFNGQNVIVREASAVVWSTTGGTCQAVS